MVNPNKDTHFVVQGTGLEAGLTILLFERVDSESGVMKKFGRIANMDFQEITGNHVYE